MKEERTRISFSYPDKIKEKLQKLADNYGISLLGYVRLILTKEIKRIKRRSNDSKNGSAIGHIRN